MKQDVAVISGRLRRAVYAQQVQELFGERITVCSYSVRDGSIEHMPRRYDLYMVTTDAFDSLGDLHQYVPIDGEMMEIHVTLRWDVVRRLQSLPAGKRALFVNLSDKMCREAVTRLNQLGSTSWCSISTTPARRSRIWASMTSSSPPGDPLRPRRGKGDYRHRPAGVRQLHHDRGGPPPGAGGAAGEASSLSSTSGRWPPIPTALTGCSPGACGWRASLRCSWRFWMRDRGGQRAGEVFACNRKLEDHRHPLRRGPAPPRRRGVPLPALCPLPEGEGPQPARVVSAGGVNINVAVAPVLRGTPASAPSPRCSGSTMRRTGRTSCAASFSTRATGPKYTFDDVVGQSPASLRCITILKKMSLTPCRCSSSARRALARSCLPTRCTTPPHAPAGPSWPSTAPPCRKTCWRASCSATRRGPSPAPGRGASRGCLSLPTGAPSSWTRWRA